MWFFGGSTEPELPADEDEAARAEMVSAVLPVQASTALPAKATSGVADETWLSVQQEMEQDLLGEMNRQMVEAKLQLEAERYCVMMKRLTGDPGAGSSISCSMIRSG